MSRISSGKAGLAIGLLSLSALAWGSDISKPPHGDVPTPGAIPFVSAVPNYLTEDPAELFWDDAGNLLGVGVNDPDAKVEIFSAAVPQLKLSFDADSFVTFALDTSDDLTIQPAAAGGVRFQPTTTDTADFFQVLDQDGGTAIVTVDAVDERVGIGIDAPQDNLHVSGVGGADVTLSVQRQNPNGSIGHIQARADQINIGSFSSDPVTVMVAEVTLISLALPTASGTVGVGRANVDHTGTLDVLNRRAADSTLMQVGTDGTNPSAVTTEFRMWDGATQAAVPLITLFDNAGANGLGLDRDGAGLLGVSNGVAGTNTGDIAFELWVGTAVLQAALGTPANGTFLYCSDCTIASPCAGGGTGALAKRLNGVWVCN